MPPRTEALRHSGGESRLRTSSTVTLYFCVELRRDRRPGTRQNMSLPLIEEEEVTVVVVVGLAVSW